MGVVWRPHLTASHGAAIVWCGNLAIQIVLIWWWNYILLACVGYLLVVRTWDVDLLSLATDRRLDVNLLVFDTSWIHPLVIYDINTVISWALIRLVEILGSLVKLMNVLNVLHILLPHWFDLNVVELVGIFNVFVEAASSWASSWIRWRLPLPFNTLNDFACLLVDSAKWVNCIAVLRTVIHDSVGHLSSLLAWHAYLIWLANKHLVSGSMGHVLFINLWGNVHVVMISHYDLVMDLMLPNICWVLLSLSSDNALQTILNIISSNSTICARKLWMLRWDVHNRWVDNFGLVDATIATLLCHYSWSLLLVVLRCLNCCLEGLLWDDLGSYMHCRSL